jgi:hypothetical protein
MSTNPDDKYTALQAIGASAAESIREMLQALECDYDRLEELRDERDSYVSRPHEDSRAAQGGACTSWVEEFPEEAEKLAELEAAAGECEDRDDAERRIHDDPLSVEVRSGWHSPAGTEYQQPEEFCILLGTGGPATRIRGELDEHCEPRRAWLEAQDWGTPWTQYLGDAITQEELLTYCRCFYFGEVQP